MSYNYQRLAGHQIDVLLAIEAPVAAILCTNPYGHVQMWSWNLQNDRVESGQWTTSGLLIEECDLSPNGQHLVASFYDTNVERRKRALSSYRLVRESNVRAWTSVSVVPFFTAVGLWFTGHQRTAGGLWWNDNLLELNLGDTAEEVMAPPTGLQYEAVHRPRDARWVQHERLLRAGWQEVIEEPPIPLRENVKAYEKKGKGILLRQGRGRGNDSYKKVWSIQHDDGWLVREWSFEFRHRVFLDIDYRSRVVFADKGCVYAWEGCPEGKPKKILDLNHAEFENVAPPPGYHAEF